MEPKNGVVEVNRPSRAPSHFKRTRPLFLGLQTKASVSRPGVSSPSPNFENKVAVARPAEQGLFMFLQATKSIMQIATMQARLMRTRPLFLGLQTKVSVSRPGVQDLKLFE